MHVTNDVIIMTIVLTFFAQQIFDFLFSPCILWNLESQWIMTLLLAFPPPFISHTERLPRAFSHASRTDPAALTNQNTGLTIKIHRWSFSRGVIECLPARGTGACA